jgi:hypothetical protein
MRRRLALIVGLGVLFLIALVIWGWVPEDVSYPGCRLAQNAAWISVDWTSQLHDESAVRDLADKAANRKIRYLFPYATYIKADGSFSPSYTHAAEFVSQFRRNNRDILLFAWVGIPLKGEGAIGPDGWVDLSDATTRHKIVTFVARLVKEGQFDGVHLNVETVHNNDRFFLLFLEEVRQAIGNAKLSIAASHWTPDWAKALPFLQDVRWTTDYYRLVAQRVDQMATMTYDSSALVPVLYRLWMREQVRGITHSLSQSPVELLIGISVARAETLSHHPQAEDLGDGLAGVCAGLVNSDRPVQGVAIYADWDFSSEDQQIWTKWSK